ncbi:MAG: DUF58 domain-containing protein [Chloroflexota bacterium]
MFPTLRGLLFLLFAVPLLALGTWLPVLEWLGWLYAGLIVAVMAVDWRLAGNVRRFEVIRRHESRLSLGAENAIHVEVFNRFPRPAGFWLRDEPPDAFGVDIRTLQGQSASGGRWCGVYHVHPLRRGNYQFGNFNMRWYGPLGLIVRQGQQPAGEGVKVYPNLLDVHRYDLLLRRNRLQEMGLRQTRLAGEGTEFERLREYLPDDDFRNIDWKATARRHRPITAEYQTERSQNVIAVLDAGRMMQSPVAEMAKLDYVINAVLFLSYVATGKGDRVGMMTFADEVLNYLTPHQGRAQFYRMLETLYAVQAQPVEPNYQKALAYLATKQRKRALIVIFTDLSSGPSLEALIAQATSLARSSLPLVVTISDPDVYTAAHQLPTDSISTYRRAAAVQLLDERRLVLESLHRKGVLTLDVPANRLSLAVINRYLDLKARSRL